MPPTPSQPRRLNYLVVMPRLVRNIGDGYSFPLGIPYVSSCMKAAGFRVIPLNLNHRPGEITELIKTAVREHQIDVVATGGLSFQYNSVRAVIQAAKEADPQVTTVVGGGIITSDPETAMEALELADFGVIGEGEVTVGELCRVLETGADVAEVDGLIYRNGDGYARTRPRKELESIDAVPWPDYEGFELEKCLAVSPSISGLNRKNTVFMVTSRSCPYNCTFCFHTTGKKYRQRSLDAFFEELDYVVAHYKIECVCIADELFGRDIPRVKEFCERIRKYDLQWWAQFRVDTMTAELLSLLKEGGCTVMSFGLESADNRILKSMRKGTTVEQMERTLTMVYQAGISLEGAFIFGDIEETWETANNTLTWWRSHPEFRINLNVVTTYPGTYLYQHACSRGIISDKVRFLRGGCPQVNVSRLSDEEVGKLLKIIMDAPWSLIRPLSDVELHDVDCQTGRIDLSASCVVCGQKSRWDDAKLFSATFLGCKHCGEKFNLALPAEVRVTIENNLVRLMEKYGKVALWGVNYQSGDLFKPDNVLQDERLYVVDISSLKQKMLLCGKRIFSPAILDEQDIEVVIVAIPAFFREIEGRMKASPGCRKRKVLDISRLTDPRFRED